MSRKFITLSDGNIVYHGENVRAVVETSYSETKLVEIYDCKLYIDAERVGDETVCFLCQNQVDGGDSPDKLGYKYSWYVRINKDGVITSSDTKSIQLAYIDNDDDDPMPEEWVIDDEIPKDL